MRGASSFGDAVDRTARPLDSQAIEDPDQVDVRRDSVGEMPLADYACVAAHLCPTP
ncbi:hypothetical protein XHV734_4310 [Xanthomonas hortorum pv. vitians]|nr:hypothetical protein XHV734_4310 [Xanthomonas hortorum pv. vitians]